MNVVSRLVLGVVQYSLAGVFYEPSRTVYLIRSDSPALWLAARGPWRVRVALCRLIVPQDRQECEWPNLG